MKICTQILAQPVSKRHDSSYHDNLLKMAAEKTLHLMS